MRDEIIKKNLIITITSLLLFFLFSFFATSYSIRNTFENEVVSVSQMVENQLESNDNDTEVINSFTYNQSWMKIIYATNTGLIMIDSENDNVELASRIQEDKLALLNNIEANSIPVIKIFPSSIIPYLISVQPISKHNIFIVSSYICLKSSKTICISLFRFSALPVIIKTIPTRICLKVS